ncbi:MAG: glycerophosphodiester phosphodiesterase [Candidatus Dormibacteraeota bacterium]|nr:glycerophosphodiester phosphodiesterase [Candidatus Dormibacteraeota bacterium]
MPAFEHAVSLGYRWLETDVHVTADGVVVAFHDDRLDRVTDRRGRIIDLTIDEVRQADAGYWFTVDGGETYPFRGRGVTVPLLEELLTRWPDVCVNIDAKASPTIVPLMRLLHRLDALSRVCLASFSDRRVQRMRTLARGPVRSSMGWLAATTAFACSRAGRMPRLGAVRIQVPMRAGSLHIDRRFVDAAHRAGMAVDVWTINTPDDMQAALDLGVDGLMSDRLQVLKSVLVARGGWENQGAMSDGSG